MKIRSTVKPDIQLSFNDWMKYIREQVNKTKK
jgi:hypothetical protein